MLREVTIYNITTAGSEPAGHAALNFIQGHKIPESVMRKVRDLQWEDFVTATAGVPEDRQKAAWKRRAEVLRWKTIPTVAELAESTI